MTSVRPFAGGTSTHRSRLLAKGHPTTGSRLIVQRYVRFREGHVAGERPVAGPQCVSGGHRMGGRWRVAGGRLVGGPSRRVGVRPVSCLRLLWDEEL
jgi:hypothetical protein